MTPTKFRQLFREFISELETLSNLKGGEYAPNADRLENFKRNAEELGLTPFDVWAVYAGKHWDAVRTFVRDQREGRERPRLEDIGSRAHDLALYCILFLALVEDLTAAKAPEETDSIRKLIWEEHV